MTKPGLFYGYTNKENVLQIYICRTFFVAGGGPEPSTSGL